MKKVRKRKEGGEGGGGENGEGVKERWRENTPPGP